MNPLILIGTSALIAMVPVGLGLLTSYLKLSLVFGFLRSAFNSQQTPSGLVIMALSLALSVQVMRPVVKQSLAGISVQRVKEISERPQLISAAELQAVLTPWREFWLRHAGRRELAVLTGADVATCDLGQIIAAFVLSELKEAFAMGLALLLPFLAIDLIVSSLLVGLGLTMLTPNAISLPLKLLLFVWCDGWLYLSHGLLASYSG